jgi:hypothetical protein
MEILYKASDVHKAIKRIFNLPNQRRVAVVAYVGNKADKYLPAPQGIQIICCPEPGATDPDAIRKLLKRGANIQFSDGLHTKVYWSETGCIITSANISYRALGCHPQQEVGVAIESSSFDIDRLIKESQPYEITTSLMDQLSKKDRIIKKAVGLNKKTVRNKEQFMDWYDSPHRETWKIGWWSDPELEISEAAKKESKNQYNTIDPKEALNISKNQASAGEWLLTFQTTETGIKNIKWIFIDFIVEVNSNENAYEEEYPFQAIQVHSLTHCPQPPFHKSPDFINAFKKAVKEYGTNKIEDSNRLIPTKELLDLTRKNMTNKNI